MDFVKAIRLIGCATTYIAVSDVVATCSKLLTPEERFRLSKAADLAFERLRTQDEFKVQCLLGKVTLPRKR